MSTPAWVRTLTLCILLSTMLPALPSSELALAANPAAPSLQTTATLQASVRFQGRTSGASAYLLPLTLKLYAVGNTLPAYTFSPTTDSAGAFTVAGITPGTYDVEVKQAEALSRKASSLVFAAGATVTLRLGTLTTGDSDNNNLIDIVDFSLLRSVFGSSATCGTATLPPPSCSDYDGSGQVDIVDFSLLRSNFGQLGPLAPSTDPSDSAPPLDPTVATQLCTATAFLYAGATAVQTGVAPGTIDCARVAVVRGKALQRTGTALAGVTVKVLGHPEYGQTLTRPDGAYDLAVNGGGLLTLTFEKTGYLPVQRQVTPPWQDYAPLADVVLTPLDAQVTPVDLSAAIPFQVAQGSPVTDSDGTRRATLLFGQGTTATVNGTPMTNLHVRATEYTVGLNGPQAMPGVLPPSSGYTYAVELSADEAPGQDVQFSQPVVTYVENFLNFPVGGIVPVGYYDRVKAAWIPADNGKVIKILSITGGVADLDTNGDGTADNAATLTALGVTDAERAKLATLYTAGQTLWRVPITHFTPWDSNWPYGFPLGAGPPGGGGGGGGGNGPGGQNTPNNDCIRPGSVIQCQSQTLGEALPITGTPFNLSYGSDRTLGRKTDYTLEIPLSGATLPVTPPLRIDLEIAVAGQMFRQSFPPAPNQRYTFTWDGKDAYGRAVQGTTEATVRVGNVYKAVYQTPAQLAQSFASLSGIPLSGDEGRQEVTLWRETRSRLGILDFRPLGLGGWSLSPQHVYDRTADALYQGDGTRRDVGAIGAVITTVAGTGSQGFSGDGGPATKAAMDFSNGVAVAPDGSLYFADTANYRVRRVGPNGIITTVAGNGTSGFGGDGGPATQAKFVYPDGIAIGPDGSLYIVDRDNHRIRRVGPDGIITTVAGNGTSGFSGDGGPATQAQLRGPTGIAVTPDGSLFVGDQQNQRIRRIRPDGVITTVAGNGASGFSGDGGPATQAALNFPGGVAVAPDGSVYFADVINYRIRRVGPDGIISTVAGNACCGFSGDGGPAIQAQILEPVDVAVASDGSLYIVDRGNARIRRVGTDGIITTLAGNGNSSFSGEGGPATQTALNYPNGVAVAPDGNLYIADSQNYRIRRVASATPGLDGSNTFSNLLIPSEDGAELYSFTGEGRHLRTLNALTGNVRYQFGYDSAGRLSTIADGDGNQTVIERNASGQPSAIVAPYGQRTTLTVDSNGYLASVTNPANEAVGFTSTPNGLLLTQTDPAGGLSHYTYDALGRLIKDEDPAGGVQTLTRTETANGHSVALTTALGRTATYEVESLSAGGLHRINSDLNGARTDVVSDPDGTEHVTQPDGVLITLTRGPDPRFGMLAPRLVRQVRTLPGGQTETTTSTRTVTLSNPLDVLSLQALTDTVTVNNRVFTSSYSAVNHAMTQTSAESRQTVSNLDAQERVTSQTLATGELPITVTYDSHGRVVENHQGAQSWTFTYDPRGRVATRTDAAGQVVSFQYDNNDRLTRQTSPSGAATRYAYDLRGNRTQVILPSGASHTLGYSAVNQEAAYTPPSNGSYLRAFNVDRALTRTTLPGGRFTDQSYDATGRVSGLSSPEAVTGFSYLASDLTERVASVTHTPSSGPAQNLAYGYNGSLLSSMTATGVAPAQVSYSYDNNLLLTNATLVSGADTVATALTWDQDGLLKGFGPFTFTPSGPGGALSQIADSKLATNYTYDNLARLSSRTNQVNGQAALAVQLTYNTVGQIVGKTETVSGSSHTFAYTYDLDGQLTQVRRDGTLTEQYAYDVNGNRTSRQLGSSPLEAASYDAQDRLLQRGAVAYQINTDGFLTQRGSDTFTYSARGQLLQATVGGQPISYAYDGLGRRVSRTDGSGTTQYLYGDPASQLITAVRSPSGELTTLYYDTAGLLIALQRGGVRFYVATDQVGTPRVVSDSAGTVVKVVEDDSLGNLLGDSNPAFDLPIGYAGGLADAATGLVHFGVRDYEPAVGRWTARDPALFAGGQGNLYVYVGNSPVGNRDPLGLFCVSATLYDGYGGGVKTCITSQGASVCGEVGFGVGADATLDSGGLDDTGGTVGLELSAKCGPVGVGAEISLDTAGCLKAGGQGQLGPVKYKTNGKKGEAGAPVEGAPETKLSEKCSAQGKLYGSLCLSQKL